MRIVSPYKNEWTGWLRGNLHTHTANSDGPLDPQATIDVYAGKGYDFLVITDHDLVSDLAGLDARGMVLIPGNEVTANGPHVLHVGATRHVAPDPDRQRVVNEICADGGLSVFCHPNWESTFNHCPQEKLEQYEGYTGLEIFNGVAVWVEGNPYATDRWDRLLSQGRHVWGFADDDCHIETDLGVGWNVVQSAGERTAAAILEGLREGRFYASTGVTIERIRSKGLTIEVRTREKAKISVITNHGRRVAVTEGKKLAFTVPPKPAFSYFRFECSGFGDRKAWTQPFFISRDE
ncbi:MAG TPA: CehA/McbA family metallohydrolase [Candidatus Bathyarchaeia archaeon]|nr:CehA/McbA family metallohydrolase [Candidatus Bathyarchaeia archaeon]